MPGNDAALLLHRLRTERGLSQAALAARAGVSTRTLARWEHGDHKPSLPELDAVLHTLAAAPADRAQVMGSLTVPRAQRRLLRETVLSVAGQKVSAPVGGDLLRALRLRRGRTQAEAARLLGVTQTTLARWETGASWPSASALHGLCWHLRAAPEEVAALTVGRFSPAAFLNDTGKPPRSAEEVGVRLRHLSANALPSSDLRDLTSLAQIAALWALGAAHNDRLRNVLADAYSDRTRFLMDEGRLLEAEEPAHIALHLVGSRAEQRSFIRSYVTAQIALTERDVYGTNGANSSAEGYRDTRTRHEETFSVRGSSGQKARHRHGLKRLERSLEGVAMSWEYQTWVLAHGARYAFGAGKSDEAIGWAERAYQVIDLEEEVGEQDRWMRRELLTRLLTLSGRPAEAVAVSPPTDAEPLSANPDIQRRAVPALRARAEALFLLGSRAEAERQIAEVREAEKRLPEPD